MIQGWKVTDEHTIPEITATGPIPDHETVVRLPARMAPFLLVPCSDFWVLDGQVVLWNHFAGDGSWVGEERCDDPAVRLARIEGVADRARPDGARSGLRVIDGGAVLTDPVNRLHRF